MPRRLDKTLIDYLVIAINPALIMALIGSLVFFLIEVFYQGNFEGRLQYIFALFIFAAVLVGRISIEQGREYAILFAVPLGIVTFIVLNTFAQFQGSLRAVSPLINLGLVLLVLWLADRLTWDCTLIDENEDDPGEGLLEAVGLDRSRKAAVQEEIAPGSPMAAGAAADASGSTGSATGYTGYVDYREPQATPSPPVRSLDWWDRFVEHRRRAHAPGVWVIYFSLAALPLFGIGQMFLSSSDLSTRQYAFELLSVYTASGLALLLATSFLGLRRYLRQRRQEMPLTMVNLWLAVGGALIVGVMALALLLPRPNAEYAISELPIRIGSPDQKSSPYGMGREGVREEEKRDRARAEKRNEKDSKSVASDQQGKAPPDGQQKSSKGQPQASQNRQDTAQAEQNSASDDKKATKQQDGQAKPKQQAQEEPSKQDQSGSGKTGDKKPSDNAQPQRGSRGSKPIAPKLPHERISLPGPPSLLTLFKWFIYVTVITTAALGAWKHRDALLAALGEFAQWLSDLWNGLFGGRKAKAKEAANEAARLSAPPRFTDFSDPFASGAAGRYSPEELVRYTFEAFEAWGRDHGCERQPEQTPHEFTRRVAAKASSLSNGGRLLADLYCQVAYAPDEFEVARVARLSHLWRRMRAQANVIFLRDGPRS